MKTNRAEGGAIHPTPQRIGGQYNMKKQTIEFATVINNGAIEKLGKSSVLQPRTNFKGGSVKWYEDRKKGGKEV